MKKSLMVLASFLLGISAGGFRSAAAIVLPRGTITLNWNYPALTTNITFNVYHTTDLRQPMRTWALVLNTNQTTCTLPKDPIGNHFCTVTASNLVTKMESPFTQ